MPNPASPCWDWTRAKLQGGELTFHDDDGFERACADGFFLLDQPWSLSLEAGDRFAENFYRPAEGLQPNRYRGFSKWTSQQLAPNEGYYLRDHDQTEQFFLEARFWESVFPAELAAQAVAMRDLSIAVLRAVFSRLDLPRDLWSRASGGAIGGEGTYHLTFNHFRPEVAARGLNVHKDSGWVTLLRSIEPGLEVMREGFWRPLDPEPGTFIVNFGCAIEILTRDTATPVAAIAHRVRRQLAKSAGAPDRFSYALFVDSNLDPAVSEGLYRYTGAHELRLEYPFQEFLNRILKDTYDVESEGLYADA